MALALVLSPPKTVLLAVHFATAGDVDSLTILASNYDSILRPELLLRILLTYLPETLPSAAYVPLLQQIDSGEFEPKLDLALDCSPVESLSDNQAAKKVKRLGLLHLSWPDAPTDISPDLLTVFLILRAYKVDEGARLTPQLPYLIGPFLARSHVLTTWAASVQLPFLRRCHQYYNDNLPLTLQDFSKLDDEAAVDLLLVHTAVGPESYPNIGRDLKGLIGPWLHNEARWTGQNKEEKVPPSFSTAPPSDSGRSSPGFERVLEWLTAQAAQSWHAAVSAIEQWDGPADANLGGYQPPGLSSEDQECAERRYARACIASAYLVSEPSVEALKGAYSILARISGLLDQDHIRSLQMAASMLTPLSNLFHAKIISPKNTTYIRNDLLDDSNVLTSPTSLPLEFLHALILSAFLLTRAGVPSTVRAVGELALLDNEHEQREEFQKLLRAICDNGRKADDAYWKKARYEILWLRDWGAEEELGSEASKAKSGIFRLLPKAFIEAEILKALLSNNQYSLARSRYEDDVNLPLRPHAVRVIVITSAMNAYDNASNPNRTRGGVKRCDDIIYAFPKTVDSSLPAARRIEALLRATHSLSSYRLVLKQGEPFTPVVLRVHPDAITIIGKVLEQNPKSYTRLSEMLEIGENMVKAGLTGTGVGGGNSVSQNGKTTGNDNGKHHTPAAITAPLDLEWEKAELGAVERRVTAMCIDAALAEHDFETAYSYVSGPLARIAKPVYSSPSPSSKTSSPTSPKHPARTVVDHWSWHSALTTGRYKRTSQTLKPTHVGTSSLNPSIRHLEQRIECLATALRIAPPHTLQEILNTFRRCEEELETALLREEQEDEAWDSAGDLARMGGGKATRAMPGGFGGPGTTAVAAAVAGRKRFSDKISAERAVEEAPMSLFEISRASVVSAQKNLNLGALGGGLQRLGSGVVGVGSLSAAGSIAGGSGYGQVGGVGMVREGSAGGGGGSDIGEGGAEGRVRKRDQLKNAAVGTLVSGVGWLVGAQPVRGQEKERG